MYQIGNIYVISAIAIMGGGLFGFDISAMSAMYVWTAPLESAFPFVDRFAVSPDNLTSATSTRRRSTIKANVSDQTLLLKVA